MIQGQREAATGNGPKPENGIGPEQTQRSRPPPGTTPHKPSDGMHAPSENTHMCRNPRDNFWGFWCPEVLPGPQTNKTRMSDPFEQTQERVR